jgi:hypothetical protein
MYTRESPNLRIWGMYVPARCRTVKQNGGHSVEGWQHKYFKFANS